MQRLPFLCLLLIVSCDGTKTPTAATKRTDSTVQGKPTTALKQGRSRATGQSAKALLEKARLDVRRRQIRQKKYKRQGSVKPADTVVREVIALIPPNMPHKTIGFEIHHGMKQVKLAPQRKFHLLRWLTMTRGPTLRQAIKTHVESRGWAARGGHLNDGWAHDEHGVCKVQIQEKVESPTEVTFTIESTLKEEVAFPWQELSAPMTWLDAVKKTPVEGFELSRFHGVHFGASFTDIERIALAVRPVNEQRFRKKIRQDAIAAGFARRTQKSESLIHKKERRSIRITQGKAGRVVIHIQARWGDSKAAFKKRGPAH